MTAITRGELAKRCEVSFETVRYYEQQGLIAKPGRSSANYRIYDEGTVRRVQFVKRAQELGFTLKEIGELLALRASPRARCADVYARAQARLADIDSKMRSLRAMRRALAKLMEECKGGTETSECPILDSLEDEG